MTVVGVSIAKPKPNVVRAVPFRPRRSYAPVTDHEDTGSLGRIFLEVMERMANV
jgi:hypothetical protein